jgi:hypothetical protein
MNQGRRPARGARVLVGAQTLAIIAVTALGTAGVAYATGPKEGGGPPEHAQGNGKPEAPPAAQQAPAAEPQQNGKAKGHAKKESAPTGGEVQTGGDAHGKSGGGHDKARGNGHVESGGQAKSGGSEHAKAGKVTLCHATGSATNPYVTITISANAVPAHDRHQDGRDIIPAPAGGCPGGSSQTGDGGQGNENEHGKVTLCHATGSETNPYVIITISKNALDAHLRHQDGEDIYPAPDGGCPATEIPAGVGNPPSGIVSPPGGELAAGGDEAAGGDAPAGEVLGVSEESGSAPDDDEAGAVLGANQGGGEEGAAAGDADGGSLPFTGLGLGLMAAIGLLLALSGRHLRRKAS